MELSSSLPLHGVKVVEVCQVAAGPFCGMLLADYGAEVIKIEPPAGDSLRQWPPISDGFSENFASLNRGKKSVALNLKDPEELEFARKLILDADVVIENNRPGVMDRLGVGWDWCKAQKPSLVYCSISAYGQSGPRSKEGGFDVTIQAASGVMSVTGDEDGDPVKCGVPISDFTAGLYAAFSISSLLNRVRQTGEGGHIDIPMFSTTLAVAALQTSQYFGTGSNPKRLGSAHPRNAPYRAFNAKDGNGFVIAAGNNKLWHAVCDVVGRMDLYDDERFETSIKRAINQKELKAILDEYFIQENAKTWLDRFIKAGVPCAAINGYGEALDDAQTKHLQLVQPITLPGGHSTKTVGCPVWLDGVPIKTSSDLPKLDEHRDLLKEAIHK